MVNRSTQIFNIKEKKTINKGIKKMTTKTNNYTAIATVKRGRSGQVKKTDGVLDLNVSVVVEFGGQENGYTNPK
ncbi:MAG: organic hydroperoxide reductase OsmC/OhrA [Patiriisocius sp.]